MPDPDLGQARARARRMRARRRWTATAAAVVVLGGAAMTVAALRSDDHRVQVVGPSGSTSVPPTPQDHPTSTGTLPNGLPITLTLETPTVVLGDEVRATAVVRNDTDRTTTLGVDPIQCALEVDPILRNAAGDVVASDTGGALCRAMAVNLWPHTSRSFAVKLPTTAVTLPAGASEATYSLALVEAGGFEFRELTNAYVSVPVRIVVPEGITARLELPKSSYPAETSVDGTIAFFNGTGRPVDYHIDCTRKQPWDVLLSKDGVLFEVPQAAVGCAANSGATAHLAPGQTRIPFYVNLGYVGCAGDTGTIAMPKCTGDPPGTPDLPPGRYQLVFRGTGAPFASLDVPPLDVDVTARPASHAIDNLPKVTSANPMAAQQEFEALYWDAKAPYAAALADRGAAVIALYSSGDRLVLQVAPSDRLAEVRTSLLSLFDHPEMVTVQEAVIVPQ